MHDSVKDYYGKRLKTADDLQTQACVTVGKVVTKPVREAVAAVHDEVASKLVFSFIHVISKQFLALVFLVSLCVITLQIDFKKLTVQ